MSEQPSYSQDPSTAFVANEAPRRGEPLREYVRDALESYFAQLDGQAPNQLYKMVLQEIEIPLLETVLRYAGGNQTKAAEFLGINRATLRKKLRHYQIEQS
jgi:Fis family transcriptional regulator